MNSTETVLWWVAFAGSLFIDHLFGKVVFAIFVFVMLVVIAIFRVRREHKRLMSLDR